MFPSLQSSMVRLRLEGWFISREITDMGMSLQGVRGAPDDARVLGGTDRRAEDATHALSYQTNVVMRSFAGQDGEGRTAGCFVERLLFRKFESRRWLLLRVDGPPSEPQPDCHLVHSSVFNEVLGCGADLAWDDVHTLPQLIKAAVYNGSVIRHAPSASR